MTMLSTTSRQPRLASCRSVVPDNRNPLCRRYVGSVKSSELKMKTVRTSMLHRTHSITKKSPGKEENAFNVIVSELKKLEHDFSTDVAVLREQIELASLDFTEAQKKFDNQEREYIAAKLDLFVKRERKEQLTTHLCSLIKRNEIEKAKTISGFVGKLELASRPAEKQINEQGDSCDKQTQDEGDTSKDSVGNIAGQ